MCPPHSPTKDLPVTIASFQTSSRTWSNCKNQPSNKSGSFRLSFTKTTLMRSTRSSEINPTSTKLKNSSRAGMSSLLANRPKSTFLRAKGKGSSSSSFTSRTKTNKITKTTIIKRPTNTATTTTTKRSSIFPSHLTVKLTLKITDLPTLSGESSPIKSTQEEIRPKVQLTKIKSGENMMTIAGGITKKTITIQIIGK